MISSIKAAKLLGWTSLAVGLTELLATDWVQDELGVTKHKTILRTFGVREIVAGVTILAQPGLNRSLVAGLWARVAGDALDIVALGESASESRNSAGFNRILAIIVTITGIDLIVALRANRNVCHAMRVSREARERVTRTVAQPKRAQGIRHSSGANTLLISGADQSRSVLETAVR